MTSGKPIPVWYSPEDRTRLEEAAVLAGYKHLSKYIRDKSLGRGAHHDRGLDNIEAWANRQEFVGRLFEIERSQKSVHALLTMLFFLIRQKCSRDELTQLLVACKKSNDPTDVLTAAHSELATLLNRFLQDP